MNTLYINAMQTNIKELRKEAYNLWGIGSKKVIYDFPNDRAASFIFKLNYSEENASWPRAYALAVSQNIPMVRVLVPIYILKRVNGKVLPMQAWYDMPTELHEQIVRLATTKIISKKLPFWKNFLNCILPDKYRFSNRLDMKEFTFIVTVEEENDLSIRVQRNN